MPPKKDSPTSQIVNAAASLGIVGLLGWIGSTAVDMRDGILSTKTTVAAIEKAMPGFVTRDEFAQFRHDIEWVPYRGAMMPRYASTNGVRAN